MLKRKQRLTQTNVPNVTEQKQQQLIEKEAANKWENDVFGKQQQRELRVSNWMRERRMRIADVAKDFLSFCKQKKN